MNIFKFKKQILKGLLYISILFSTISLITIFIPSMSDDEAFSMAMVHHTYSSMLHLSYFDVHPPLYYLILKTFLTITTFWTKSILIKIMFAKALSIIFLAITFYILCSILKEYNIRPKIFLQLILYLITLPTIILMSQIRMYELATLFIAIELYGLVKFTKYNKSKFLIISIISASLASYTHYFAAMFAGSLLVVYTIRTIQAKNWMKFYKFIISILIFIILFIPCLWFAYRQFTYVVSSKYRNIQANVNLDKNIFIQIIGAISSINFHEIAEVCLGFIITFILIYLTIHYLHIINNKLSTLLINIVWTLSISILIPLIFSFINHPIIQGRYYYPIMSIYDFILIGIILKYINFKKMSKGLFSILTIIILCFSFGNIAKARTQYKTIDLSSLYSYREITSLPYNIYKIPHYKYTDIEQDSVYFENKKSKNKPIFYETTKQMRSDLGANNKKLLNGVFNNLHIKYK